MRVLNYGRISLYDVFLIDGILYQVVSFEGDYAILEGAER